MLRVLREAQIEVADASFWYDCQQPGLAVDFMIEFERVCARIQKFPLFGAPLAELNERGDFRHSLMRRFPYAVIYLIRGEDITVVAVSHARRKPLYWHERIE